MPVFIKNRLAIRYCLALIILMSIISVNSITKANQDGTIVSLQKIDDFPLYFLDYPGDYSFDKFLRHGAKNLQELNRFLFTNKLLSKSIQEKQDGACSCFAAANLSGEVLMGRNYDLPGKPPVLLLSTHPLKGYASLSLVNLNVLNRGTQTGNNAANILAAPYFPADGMNEHGVAVAILSVPAASLQSDPTKVTLLRWQVSRLILDYARNVEEAIALVSKYNVNVNASGTFIHYFIADASGRSAVVEFGDGKMQVTRSKEPGQAVTNFILYNNSDDVGRNRYVRLNRVLSSNQGLLSETGAMDLLRLVSLDTTVWSAVYNLHDKEVYLSLGKQYDQVKKFPVRTAVVSK